MHITSKYERSNSSFIILSRLCWNLVFNSEMPKTGNLSTGYFCNNYLLSAFSSSSSSFQRDVIRLKYTADIQQNALLVENNIKTDPNARSEDYKRNSIMPRLTKYKIFLWRIRKQGMLNVEHPNIRYRIFVAARDKSLDSRARFAYLNIIDAKSSTKKVVFTGYFAAFYLTRNEKKKNVSNVSSRVKWRSLCSLLWCLVFIGVPSSKRKGVRVASSYVHRGTSDRRSTGTNMCNYYTMKEVFMTENNCSFYSPRFVEKWEFPRRVFPQATCVTIFSFTTFPNEIVSYARYRECHARGELNFAKLRIHETYVSEGQRFSGCILKRGKWYCRHRAS